MRLMSRVQVFAVVFATSSVAAFGGVKCFTATISFDEFGTVAPGTSKTSKITVTPTEPVSFTVTQDTGEFDVDPSPGTTGSPFMLDVTLAPTEVYRGFEDTITIRGTIGGSLCHTENFFVDGNSGTGGAPDITPSGWDFGEVEVGQSDQSGSIVVEGKSNQAVTATIKSSHPGVLVADKNSFDVVNGSMTSVKITFSPDEVGTLVGAKLDLDGQVGTFEVGSIGTISILGKGIAGPPEDCFSVSIPDPPEDCDEKLFCTVAPGSSKTESIRVDPTQLVTFTVSQQGDDEFSVGSIPGATDEDFELDVTLSPTTVYVPRFAADITITGKIAGIVCHSQTFTVAGDSGTGGEPEIIPPSWDFGKVEVGQSVESEPIVVNGKSNLAVSVNLASNLEEGVLVSSNSRFDVVQGSMTSMKITFSPEAVGKLQGAQLDLEGRVGTYPVGSVGTISIKGEGTPAPLAITTLSLQDGVEGVSYNEALQVSGGSAPFQWSISTGSPPPGLTLSTGGTISGTPADTGDFNFTVKVTDDEGTMDTQALSISVAAGVMIATTSLPAGVEGVSYDQTLSASGGSPPLDWDVVGGSLPPGLALSTGGTISGTPTDSDDFNFTVKVADDDGAMDTQALSIQIADGLTVTTTSLPDAVEGNSYTHQLTAAGGELPLKWSTSGANPPGLVLSEGGLLSGTPTSEGEFSFRPRVTDNLGASASRLLFLTVQPPDTGPPPFLLDTSVLDFGLVRLGSTAVETIAVTTLDSETLEFNVTSSDPQLIVSPSVFQLPPDSPGTVSITFEPTGPGRLSTEINVAASFANTGVSAGPSAMISVFGIAAPPGPVLTPEGFLDPTAFMAPPAVGGLGSAFGDFGVESGIAVTLPLPTTMNEAKLLFGPPSIAAALLEDGQAGQLSKGATPPAGMLEAPLLFVSATQFNFQVPWGLQAFAPGTATAILQVGDLLSPPVEVPIETFSPGIFTMTGTGSGPAAVTTVNGEFAQIPNFLPGLSGTPVPPGGIIVMFVSGLGPVAPPVETGDASVPTVVSQTVVDPQVLVGGVPATVVFSGLAPGFVGLYQVNAFLSASTPTGDTVPIELIIDGKHSQPDVWIAVGFQTTTPTTAHPTESDVPGAAEGRR